MPYDTEQTTCTECGEKAIRGGIEVPAKRNPVHGLQTDKI